MAKIFLSYARDDAPRAERIASALQNAGHDVWWDREISAGSSFSNEIDSALKDAELIVVLWSSRSIRSDWVRDEAAIGRDSGRLLPALIEPVDPPLGFRQYQAVTLFARGREPVKPLITAIDRKLGAGPSEDRRELARRPPLQMRRPLIIAASVLALLTIAAGGWWLWSPDGFGDSIAVVSVDSNSAPSRDLARSLARDLGRIRSGPLGSMAIIEDAGAAANSAYRIEVASSGTGNDLRADVAIKQKGYSGILWSGLIEEPDGRPVDLREHVAAKVGQVLYCVANLGNARRDLSADSMTLYMHGCSNDNADQAVGIYQELTRKEPKFGPGWSSLAIASAQSVPNALGVDRPALIAQARSALVKAKALAPDFPDTAIADALIQPGGGATDARALAILDRAIALNPNAPSLRGHRTDSLQALGRMREAIAESRRALDLNPLSPALLADHARALAYGGQTEAGYAVLAKAEKDWPGASSIVLARYGLDLRFGDPARAASYLDHEAEGDNAQNASLNRAFLAARSRPSPANIEKALAPFRESYRQDLSNVPSYLQALVFFGKIDEAFAILQPAISIDSLGASTDILFRPYMAAFLADPRFMRVAKRLGLVDAWLKTGVWPDFCSTPGLPYNCRVEAAKLKSVAVATEPAH